MSTFLEKLGVYCHQSETLFHSDLLGRSTASKYRRRKQKGKSWLREDYVEAFHVVLKCTGEKVVIDRQHVTCRPENYLVHI